MEGKKQDNWNNYLKRIVQKKSSKEKKWME